MARRSSVARSAGGAAELGADTRLGLRPDHRRRGGAGQRAAGRADVAKFCKGLGDDPGLILECLEKNKDK